MAVQEDLEHGEQGHVRGGAVPSGQGAQLAHEGGRQLDGDEAAVEALYGGAGPVGGQVERGRGAIEVVQPVRQILLPGPVGQLPVLPVREVAVLDLQLGQR